MGIHDNLLSEGGRVQLQMPKNGNEDSAENQGKNNSVLNSLIEHTNDEDDAARHNKHSNVNYVLQSPSD
jgi:hypothetical protein